MLRGPKTPLKVQENKSGCPEQKEKTSLPPSRDQKSCRVTKSKIIRPSKKENFTDGNQTQPPKRALKCPKSPKQKLGIGGSCFGVLRGDVLSDPPLPLHTRKDFPSSPAAPLGNDFATPEREKVEGKSDFGLPEQRNNLDFGLSEHKNKPDSVLSEHRTNPDFGLPEQRNNLDFGLSEQRNNLDFGLSEQRSNSDFGLSEHKNNPDFAAVLSAEFGIAQEGFGKPPMGTSPASLKFRRRSTIGLRGSPENNSLIRYLAQQRSSRQKEAFTQISPFKPANVRSLKDKIDAFQASFESLQEAEGEPSKEGDSSQDKTPVKKEPNLEQWNEKFMLGNRRAALKENLSENGSKSSRRELSILSPQPAVTAPAAKEWVYEQNPIKSLEPVLTGDTLEKSHVPRCDQSDSGSDAASDPSTRKAEGVENERLGMLGGSQGPVTPLGTRNTPSCDLSQSSSLLRSILKKTPGKELRDSPKKYSNSAFDRGDESAALSSCVKTFEPLQTDTSASQSSRTPKKKKVTFGDALSPEIFDQSLPANTPLRRGASPGCAPQSPWGSLGLPGQPLPLLDWGWEEEGVEPLPELLEGSAAAETPSAVENAEVAEIDKSDLITTPTKRKQGRAVPEDTEGSSSGATTTEGDKATEGDKSSEGDKDPEDDKATENPKRSKIQRQKNPTTTAPKKSKKTKYPSFGRRKKKKVKKCLYGEREMASKKPLLSPIPEIPELFSFVSSPSSPLLTEDAGLADPTARDTPQEPQAGRICARGLCADTGSPELWAAGSELPGRLQGAAGTAQFSNAVPDAGSAFDTSEYFQQGEEAPCETETKESSSLLEKEGLPGNLLTGMEIVQEDPVRADPARRRRRSSTSFPFPPAEKLEISEADVAVCSYSLEQVLAGSLQGCRSSRASTELRVRRSMRLSRGAATEGLAWVQLPPELPKQPPRGRRSSSSTSILAGAENVHPREQNLLPLAAPGKENEGSAPARRRSRRSLCEATAPEMPQAPSQRRRSTNSGCVGRTGGTKTTQKQQKLLS